MTRTVISIAFVGLLVVGLVGVGAATTLDARQSDARNESTATVSVSGVGEASAEPDRALVYVAATATGDSSSAAVERLAANVSGLRETLAGANATDRIRTVGFQVFERRENGTTTYVARQSFELAVTDTEAVGDVIDRAVAAGATEVDGVTFTLSRERHREVRATAIERAVADARAQAEAVAASTGLDLGEVRAVSTGDRGFVPATQETADARTVVEPSPVRVTASVEITYNATSG